MSSDCNVTRDAVWLAPEMTSTVSCPGVRASRGIFTIVESTSNTRKAARDAEVLATLEGLLADVVEGEGLTERVGLPDGVSLLLEVADSVTDAEREAVWLAEAD